MSAASLIPVGAARAGSIWTPVTTGTSATISAIAWPNTNEILLATTAGSILRWTGSSFVSAASSGVGFTDIATSPAGTTAIAVGAGGEIYRSTDSGVSWAAIAAKPLEYSGSCPAPGASTAPLSDQLESVKFADASTVYATGENNDVLKSTDGGATFTEVNKSAGSCLADPGGSGQAFTDTAWTSATHGFLLSNDFGKLFETFNGLSTGPLADKNASGTPNGFRGNDRLAIDPGSPNRMWAMNPGAMSGSYFQLSTNGGVSWAAPSYDGSQNSLQDIAFSGGTVLTAGLNGDIYASANGKTFNRQIADPPYNATDWQAVALLDATHALVGGAGGALMRTSKANQLPGAVSPTPPPTGSQPQTQSTGGGTVTAFKKVTVTGHGRYIPVKISAKSGRTFVLKLLTAKGHHHVGRAVKATLKRRGARGVKLALNSKVKTGSYLLVVRVFTLNGKARGHQITFAFVLR